MTAAKKLEPKNFTYNDYKLWKDDWELINGDGYAMSPSAGRKHQRIASKIHGKFFGYLDGKPCKPFFEFDVKLSEKDVVRPDFLIVCDKNKVKENYVDGAPDFVAEILSPSTAKRDKIIKLELYKKYGVKEYWIVDPYLNSIEVHNFQEEKLEMYFMEENIENFVDVAIFKGEMKIDLNYLFEEEF